MYCRLQRTFCVRSEVLQTSGRLSGSILEKGLLQLLFDVRFLSDALAGGKPLNDTPTGPTPVPRYNPCCCSLATILAAVSLGLCFLRMTSISNHAVFVKFAIFLFEQDQHE